MLQTLKLFLSLLNLLFFFNVFAQNWQQISFEPLFGQFTIQHFLSTSNGYVGIVGFQRTIQLSNGLEYKPIGSQDILIYSINRNGLINWASAMYNSNQAQITGVSLHQDEQYIVCTGIFWDTLSISGNHYINPTGGKAIFNAKIDLINGDVQWVNVMNGTGSIKQSGGICIQKSGKIYANGWFTESLSMNDSIVLNTQNTGIYLIEIDQHGAFIDADLIGYGFDIRTSLCKCESENIYMAGAFRGNIEILGIPEEGRTQDYEAIVFKLDQNRNLKWMNTGEGVLDNWIIDLDINSDSIVAIAGHFAGNMNFKDDFNMRSLGSLFDAFIVTFDGNGQAFDSEVFSTSGTYYFNKLNRKEAIYSLNGTFDGNLFLENDTLESQQGSRSACVIYWPENHERDSFIFIEITGQIAYVADLYSSIDPTHQAYVINFKGVLSFQNQQWESMDEYRTIILESTSTNNLKELKSLKSVNWLTPNPVSETLFFSDKINELHMYDMSGKLILITGGQQSYSMQSIPSGNYIAIMQSYNGEKAYQIIIKK